MPGLHELKSRRIGLALSGGGVRGIAHIGVIKALAESGIQPVVVTGTSAGSIIGAALAAGMSWQDIAGMAREVFWPSLLHGRKLEQFCSRYFPESFADLRLPFAAIATALPAKRPVVLTVGKLATAISASCAIPMLRRPVLLHGSRLKDGGICCVLPSEACRDLGAEFIIASDVWEVSALLRRVGLLHTHPRTRHAYPTHYLRAVRSTDLLIQISIPMKAYWPGPFSVERLIAAGEATTRRILRGWRPSRHV